MSREGSIVPLFGTATTGLSPTVTSQKRVNVYVEAPKDAEKGQVAIYPRPGMTYLQRLTSNDGPHGVRGMFGQFKYTTAFDGVVEYGVVVCGSALNIGNATFGLNGNGSILTDSGPVDFALNDTQLLIVDGRTGYVLDLTSSFSMTTLEGLGTATGFPANCTSVAFLASRAFAVQPSSGKVWYSALSDFTTWGGTDFYTAESDPDDLRVVWNHNGQLALIGQYTTEFWSPGSGSTVLRKVGGAALEWGIAARQSIKRADGGTIFVGQNRLGDKKVLRLQGYQAIPISTPEIEYELQSEAVGSGVAMTLSANGHSFYKLSFPTRTFVYDMTTGVWGEETSGPAGDRWVGQHGAMIRGDYLIGDYSRNRLYKLSPDYYYDGEDMIVREVVTRHTFSDYDRTTVDWVEVDFETGVGLTSGQGSDPQVMLQVSRDNGRTWGNEMWRSIGAVGDYRKRVRWGPLGRARDWVFKFRVSDPVKVVIAGGSLKVRP